MPTIDDRIGKIATEADFEATYNHPEKAKKSLEFLSERGMLPLNLKNPNLKYLNILGLYVYLSGSLSANHYAMGYNTGIADTGLNIPVTELENQLGLKFSKRGNLRYQLYLSENGSAYARLLTAMGFHTSYPEPGTRPTKGSEGSRLPPYLEECIRQYASLSRRDKPLVRPLILDFISIWFDTKAAPSGSKSIHLYLLSQPTKEMVAEQGELFLLALNNMHPDLNLVYDPQRTYSNPSGKSFTGYIPLHIDTLLQMDQRLLSPVEIGVNVRPKFSFKN